VLDQVVLAEFMRGGHYARHLRRMRQLYGERRELFLHLLRANLASELEPLDNPTGLNIACLLPSGVKESPVVAKCHAAGLLVQPLSSFSISGAQRPRGGMLLGFASLPVPTLRTAVPKLAGAVAAAAAEQRASNS
jgi:GntR family transcriptional regulator/MocR family aminotransferase